jgi:hypothetical protein
MGAFTKYGMMAAVLGLAIPSQATVPTAAPPGAPKPGTLETYRDWTIGCDNRGRCEAVALMPEGGEWPDTPIMLGIARDAGADADAEIWTSQSEGKGRVTLTFLVDGRKLATAIGNAGEARVQGPQASALAIAMARGTAMEIRAGDKLIARPSLNGSGAAFRYMDARQGRAGTVTALIATGPLGVTAVRPSPVAPVVRRAAVPVGIKPAPLWRAELIALRKQTGCTDEMPDGPQVQLEPLSKTETLVLVPCGSGAYNVSSVPLIATGVPGRRSFRTAPFDYRPAWSEDSAHPTLVNVAWTAETSRLDSFAKGRGLGDCGGSENYVWDGTRFRLVEATSMEECRGAWHWIPTWYARVTD